MSVGASASTMYNLYFYQVTGFNDFTVAKTVVNNDKDKVDYHVDYIVNSGHLTERGVMLAKDYTQGRIIIQYMKKANGSWVFNGFEVG